MLPSKGLNQEKWFDTGEIAPNRPSLFCIQKPAGGPFDTRVRLRLPKNQTAGPFCECLTSRARQLAIPGAHKHALLRRLTSGKKGLGVL
jgi:hypothetical protein